MVVINLGVFLKRSVIVSVTGHSFPMFGVYVGERDFLKLCLGVSFTFLVRMLSFVLDPNLRLGVWVWSGGRRISLS